MTMTTVEKWLLQYGGDSGSGGGGVAIAASQLKRTLLLGNTRPADCLLAFHHIEKLTPWHKYKNIMRAHIRTHFREKDHTNTYAQGKRAGSRLTN